MGANAGGEFEVRHRDVGDPGVEEVAADGIDVAGLFACQAENDGDVVGGTPKDRTPKVILTDQMSSSWLMHLKRRDG